MDYDTHGLPTDPLHPWNAPHATAGTGAEGVAAVLLAAWRHGLTQDERANLLDIVLQSQPGEGRPATRARYGGGAAHPVAWLAALGQAPAEAHAAVLEALHGPCEAEGAGGGGQIPEASPRRPVWPRSSERRPENT